MSVVVKKLIRASDYPKTRDCRGMSNPFYFAFDILEGKKDSKGRDHPTRMLCHAVIFTSFEVPLGSEATCTICADDVDPRMEGFIRHVWSNFLKEKKNIFMAKVTDWEKELTDQKLEMSQKLKLLREIADKQSR